MNARVNKVSTKKLTICPAFARGGHRFGLEFPTQQQRKGISDQTQPTLRCFSN